jgi:hypothetical protein
VSKLSGIVFLPEMSDAGAEALKEARAQGADDATQAVLVYIAMAAVFELMLAKVDKTRH